MRLAYHVGRMEKMWSA